MEWMALDIVSGIRQLHLIVDWLEPGMEQSQGLAVGLEPVSGKVPATATRPVGRGCVYEVSRQPTVVGSLTHGGGGLFASRLVGRRADETLLDMTVVK